MYNAINFELMAFFINSQLRSGFNKVINYEI